MGVPLLRSTAVRKNDPKPTRFSADKRVSWNVMVSEGKRQAPAYYSRSVSFLAFTNFGGAEQSENDVCRLRTVGTRPSSRTLRGSAFTVAPIGRQVQRGLG
jgi:hypothetical protein